MSNTPTEHATWTPWRRANYAFFNTHLASLDKKLKLLDLGAGPLQFKDIFLSFDYTGVDFEKFDHVSIVADLTKELPIPDKSTDIITLSNTLEHIPNTEHLLKECKRVLRDHGLIIGTIPFLLPVHQAPYDFNRYTNYQLQRLFENAGFSNVEIFPLGKQIDVYNTIELKVFDELYRTRGGIVLKVIRLWRRAEMRIIRTLFSKTAATAKVTEGYGFVARA